MVTLWLLASEEVCVFPQQREERSGRSLIDDPSDYVTARLKHLIFPSSHSSHPSFFPSTMANKPSAIIFGRFSLALSLRPTLTIV